MRTADGQAATTSTRRASSQGGRARRDQSGRSGPRDGESTSAGGGRPSRHILLLDDEEGILVPTAAYFRTLGFEVDMARESEEAEALVHHRRYDLAILDLRVTRFGGTDGLEVLREIRRRDHKTKVIILSAYVSAEAEAEAWALGADSVLRKPQPLPHLAHLAFALMGAAR